MSFPWLLLSSKRLLLFCPQLQRYIVSTDVTFFENTQFPLNYTTADIPLEDHPGVPPIVPSPIIAPARPLLVVYHRHPQPLLVVPSPDPPVSSPASTAPPPVLPILDLPIALRKGIQSSRYPNHLSTISLNYSYLSPTYFSFVSSLDSVSIPKSTGEAMTDPH